MLHHLLIILLIIEVSILSPLSCAEAEEYSQNKQVYDTTVVLPEGRGTLRIILYRGVLHSVEHELEEGGTHYSTFIGPNKSVYKINGRTIKSLNRKR